MKVKLSLLLGALLALTASQTSRAWDTGGFVFCDANGNGQIDSGDSPMPGVLIVITNVSGTYSNATSFTTTPEGGFIIDLPPVPDTYVETLHPLTLPGDAVVITPSGSAYTFTFDAVTQHFLGNFLVRSASCANVTPPPPPPSSNNDCCITGGGTILKCQGKPPYTFSLHAFPGKDASQDTGKLDIIAHTLKLHLDGDVFHIVNCGGSGSCQSIEFEGAGTLKGIAGNKANYGVVYFYAHAEDCGEGKNKNDKLYVRVYGSDGTVLILISGDMANPMNISPVVTSTGNLQMHKHCGSDGKEKPAGGDCDKGGDKDKGKGGDCDQGGDKDKGDKDKGGKDKGGDSGNCNSSGTKSGKK
jgi:hypothetical protein